MKAHLTPEQLQKMQQSRQQSTQFARPGGPKDHPTARPPESQENSKTKLPNTATNLMPRPRMITHDSQL
jgi:hypothetical protein